MATCPPRQRPGKTYAGGKILRRAHADLYRRIHGRQPGNCKRPDRISNREDQIAWGQNGFTKPGSMQS